MEDSKNSSIGKALSAKENRSCAEESGWTAYFEDFSNNNMENSSCSFSLGGSSLLSDAASSAAWKISQQNLVPSTNLPRKLSFKKSRTKQISEDDDPLEDTASSPVNSPKVGGLSSAEMVSRKRNDQTEDSMSKGFTSEHLSELQREDDDSKDKITSDENNIDCTDLKKRGLCLVPMSMLVNYFG